MFLFRAKFKKLDISLVQARMGVAVMDALEKTIMDATRAWLRAVVERVPVYSGQARGTLKPLGRILDVAINNSPTANAIRKLKGIRDGETQGAFEFHRQGFYVSIIVSITLVHYAINEFHDVSEHIHLTHDVPWHSFAAGKAAYLDYLKRNLKKRIPSINHYLTGTEVING